MRKRIKILVAFLFLLVLGMLCSQFYITFHKKKALSEKLNSLPEFSMQDTQGVRVTQNDIDKADWAVFVFFNSECHYCQEEANQLVKLKTKITNIQFLWISTEKMQTINAFQKKHGLADQTDITFLHDSLGKLTTALDVDSTPQFLIYDTAKQLSKNHKGAWRIDKLLEFIENEQKTTY